VLTNWRAATAAVFAMVMAFGCAVWLKDTAGLNDSIVVLTVAVTVTLAQAARRARRRLVGVVVLPIVAVGASEVGWLFAKHPNVGGVVFTLAVSAGIWVRRFGPIAAEAGTLATLPLIAVLITPVPLDSGGGRLLWSALAAVIALAAVALTAFVFRLRNTTPPVRPPRRGAADRMALQMAVALGVAFVVGRWAYPDHWTWTVLTAYIVGSGNRGRGDVAYKSVLRILGAGAGTAAATLVAGEIAPGRPETVALILAVLAVAIWLRDWSYAYWAMGVTAALALLYGYYGQSGLELLTTRLQEIVIGAMVGVAAAWFVFPIRTAPAVRGDGGPLRVPGQVLSWSRKAIATAGNNGDRNRS